ncbi:MAG: prepilin-type N-terminal cleavage/methylation domain-containing protein [bacterium]
MSLHIRRGYKGFTLIELMVVIVIIGLLSSLATTSYLRAQTSARDNTRKTDISALSAAIETYYASNKAFPGDKVLASVTDGCQYLFSTSTYYYAYNVAKDPATTCTDAGLTHDYKPSPSWIPNLTSYINPFPFEKRYVDSDTNPSNGPGYLLTNNTTQSYFYQNQGEGYIVAARLESASSGDNYYLVHPSAGQLACPGNPHTPLTADNLFLICK